MSYVRSQTGKNVIFFGADYEKLEIKNLYKALNVAKPDLVLVQLGPEHLLENFNQNPEYFD